MSAARRARRLWVVPGSQLVGCDRAAERIVTVRNCHVEGFLNSLRVTRDGFRTLPAGAEYENGTADILVEDSTFAASRALAM